jgi:hypothetical protein
MTLDQIQKAKDIQNKIAATRIVAHLIKDFFTTEANIKDKGLITFDDFRDLIEEFNAKVDERKVSLVDGLEKEFEKI